MQAAASNLGNSQKDHRRLAVLPLVNISPDTQDEYFADGMTEELILTLSKIAQLRVIARTSIIKYKDQSKSVAEIGNELGVGSVLEGSVRKAGNKIRISVNLIDANTQEQLWSNQYDRDLQDVFAIQSDIAKKIASSLKVQILQREKKQISKKATNDIAAYSAYLSGRMFWNKRTEEGLKKSIEYFSGALGKDPAYALAYSGLADAHAMLALFEFVPPSLAFPKAREAAEQALRIDPNLAEAHTSLGLVNFQYDRDWENAEAEFTKAIELNPNYPPAHHFFADYLKAMGRFDEAMSEIKFAQELDPMSLAINTGLGHVLYLSRQYDKAIEQYTKATELDPNFLPAHLWFGRPYLQKGMFAEAITEVSIAVKLSGESTMSLGVLGHVYASAGKRKEPEEILKKLKERAAKQYVPSYWIAFIYVGLGDRDQAFAWLEKAFSERSSWLAWIKVEPRFDPLRSDVRFASLLKRMHLDDASPTGLAIDIKLITLLSGIKSLKLSDYSVVGNYTRFDEITRNKLKDLKQKIVSGVSSSSPKHENYLLWALPGSGKSFLVQQIGAAAQDHAGFVEMNLAESDESQFRTKLEDISRYTRPTICFIDEVDSKPGTSWPYETLLPHLEAGSAAKTRLVYVMAGSSTANLSEFIQNIEARPKGSDLINRVPHDNRYTIPPLMPEDRILVALSTLLRAAKQMGTNISEIEKLALYFIALDHSLSSARQLREFAIRCLERIPGSDDRVKYDNLFSPGDEENKRFWLAAKKDAADLFNSFLRVA